MTEYSNPRMTATIDNWPLGGSRRGTAHFAIEQVPGKGERGTRYTIDPRTGKPSATKKHTYASKARIVDGDDGKTYIAELSRMYRMICFMQSNLQFQAAEPVHHDNPRYPDLLKLFAAEAW